MYQRRGVPIEVGGGRDEGRDGREGWRCRLKLKMGARGRDRGENA